MGAALMIGMWAVSGGLWRRMFGGWVGKSRVHCYAAMIPLMLPVHMLIIKQGWALPWAVLAMLAATALCLLFFVSDTTGAIDDGVYVVRWNSTPRDPADIAKANALAEIDRLERSITDRMWREDAIGSTALMTINKQDDAGNWVTDADDPRTGKTATQYIAYVNSAIANIRAGL